MPSRAKRKVKYNSIIFSTVRPNQLHYGIIKNQPDNFLVSTGFTVIDIDEDKASADFIYYLLTQNDVVQHLQAIAEQSTSAYPSIKASDIENLNIMLPNLDTQKKIAYILRSLDEKIELNNKINENLEQQAQAIFKSWFVDFEPFGGVMPDDAKMIEIKDLCKVVTKGTTPTTLGMSFKESGINFVKAESILNNHSFDNQKFAFIDDETNTKLKRSIIEEGDILFTIAGTLGRFALVDDTIIPANTNQAIAIIRPNKTIVSSEYLYSFFIGNWHNEYYTKRVQQAVQANLSLTTIKTLPIIILNETDTQKYNDIIIPIFRKIKANEIENRHISKLRDTLLPKLMTGEIDVSKVKIERS